MKLALSAYEKALEANPDFVLSQYNMGITLKKLGRVDEAIVSFKKALSIEPNFFSEAWNYVGIILKEQNKIKRS